MSRIVYGICTERSRMFAFVRGIFCIEPQDAQPREWEKPIFHRLLWWARQGLNLRPHPCEGGGHSRLASGDYTIFVARRNRFVREMYILAEIDRLNGQVTNVR